MDNKLIKELSSAMRRKKKKDLFAKMQELDIDYKDSSSLEKYVSDAGRILHRRLTGLTLKQQRVITKTIKRARHVALLGFSIR